MRKLLFGALAAALLAPVVPSTAEARPYGYGNGYGYGNSVERERRECRRELRRADSRYEYRRELRECRREIARARADRHWRGNSWRNDRRDWRDDRRSSWNDYRYESRRDRYGW